MAEWIIDFVQRGGYWGIALLMLLENVFPPIPSELVLPFAGYVAATGKLSPGGVLAASVAGSLLGAVAWYWIGRRMGADRLQDFARRHGRLLTVTPDELERAQRWFRRHGAASVGFGRMAPAVRSLISVPAGISCMSPARFLAFSALGTTAWNVLLLAVGYVLESRYEQAKEVTEWVTRGVLAVLVASYLWRVLRYRGVRSGT